MNDPGENNNRSTVSPRKIYRFGQFELDPIRETLRGPEEPVLLREHAFRVLMLLVERAPEVVSRDDILDDIWGHQALSESSIAQVIRDIRSALGDSARAPELVATRYGRGYQFIGEITRDTQSEEPQLQTLQPEAKREQRSQPPSVGSQSPLWVVAGLVALALGWQWLHHEASVAEAKAQETITLQAIAPVDGEPPSSVFADYMDVALANSLKVDRIIVVSEDDRVDLPRRVIEISISSLEDHDRGTLEPLVRRAAVNEASELVIQSLDEILAKLEQQITSEIVLRLALTSDSSFTNVSLPRGMAAQMAGDVGRAARLFEAALAEDPSLDFARCELAIALRSCDQALDAPSAGPKPQQSLAMSEPSR